MSIVVRNLSFAYGAGTPTEVRALVDVSFEIGSGEFVALIGPTGSGKSTLIQHLNGLIHPRPGTVIVNGLDVGARRADLRALRRQVGLLFQYPEHQLFEETVWRDVAFGPRSFGLDPDEVDRRVQRALRLVGLDASEVVSRSPFELSGGQKRRVAMAGVLALGCETLVLDEPTAGLDPQGRRELLDLLRKLNRTGLTILLVTHNMDEVAMVANRALVLSAGRLVADVPVRELFSQHARMLEAHGLDVPAVVRLMWRLRERGAPVRPDRLTVEEAIQEILEWKLNDAHAAVAGARGTAGTGGKAHARGGMAHARRPHHRSVRRR